MLKVMNVYFRVFCFKTTKKNFLEHFRYYQKERDCTEVTGLGLWLAFSFMKRYSGSSLEFGRDFLSIYYKIEQLCEVSGQSVTTVF